MKVSVITAAALYTIAAVAAPSAHNLGGWRGNGRDRDCKKGLDTLPFNFTSKYSVRATPDQVVNGTTFTGGLPGASGVYDLGLNSQSNFLCWYIEIKGFRGEYSSPALTATHIHQSPRGQSGPPRIAFPNPISIDNNTRVSVGCQQGPFRTGILANGVDTGLAFNVGQIEANPAGFDVDVHSSLALPGAIRGQIA
ncbi:hypothetical protein LTR50_007585 [Elasticomyces elasticus]|nr:hypothetical protein LTR50_007585 [Elasticomyces elasticus]